MTTDTQPTCRNRFSGKVSVVAGGASGIGRAAAALFAEERAEVWCADLDAGGAESAALEIRRLGGSARSAALDVTSEASWAELVEAVLREHGRLDVLVNSAGISAASPIADTPLEEWRRVLAVNLDGTFLGTRAAVAAMLRTGTRGCIVNVSSAAALRPHAGAAAYAASKAGVCALTRSVAKECVEAGNGIRVNTICPGGVKTPLWLGVPFFRDLVGKKGSEDRAFATLATTCPGGRLADPREIAEAIAYLASDDAVFVTGTDLVIDNGWAL